MSGNSCMMMKAENQYWEVEMDTTVPARKKLEPVHLNLAQQVGSKNSGLYNALMQMLYSLKVTFYNFKVMRVATVHG